MDPGSGGGTGVLNCGNGLAGKGVCGIECWA